MLLSASVSLHAAVHRKYNFETTNPWTGMAGYSTAAAGAVTATPTWTTVGTIDTYGTNTNSSGIQLVVNSSGATAPWSAGVNSGILTLSPANTLTNLGLLTLSFSLSASTSHPVWVKIESYSSSNPSSRTGGLKTLIYPAAPDFYQRYALDLDKMTADGAGAFNPLNQYVKIYFEIDNTAGGDGWPLAAAHELRIDNVNYSTPKYYVKPTGSNGNGLTEATAFNNVLSAVNAAAAGDIVVIKDGADYTSTNGFGSLNIPGTPDAWIVFKNYPGQKPVLKTSGWGVISITKGSSDVPYTGTVVPAYIEVRGLTCRGSSAIDANGDRALPGFETTIGQVAGESNTNGIYIEGRNAPNAVMHHFRFADNIVEFCPGAGMASSKADRIQYENNIVRYNSWWMIYAGSGISSLLATNSETSTGYRFLMQGNVCHDNETMVPWYKSDDQDYSDGNGIIIDTHDASYTGKTLVQNNLVYNNGGSGIHVYKAHNVDIVHNTAYLNSASPRLQYSQIYAHGSMAQPTHDVRMMNNILVAPVNPTTDTNFNEPVTSIGNYTAGTIFYQNNLYFGGNITPPSGGNLNPNTTANPQFLSASIDPATNDFHLRSTSPAYNYGQAIGYRRNLDQAGKLRLISGLTDSGVYQTQAADIYAPVFTPQSGNFASQQDVTLASDTAGATIIYTTNGSTPTVDAAGNVTNGTVYAGASIPVSTATTLKAIAKVGLTTSYVSTAKYTLNITLVPIPTPTFDVAPGTYDSTQYIHILVRTPGAIVRYTTDGTDPTPTTGTVADKNQIVVKSYTNLRVIAYKPGRANSAILAGAYTISGSIGSLSDGSGTDTFGANKIRFSRFQASGDMTVTRIFARIGAITGNYRTAIYSDSTTTPGTPGTLLKASNAVTNPGTGWQLFPLTSALDLTTGSYYWLAIWSGSASGQIYRDATGGTLREATSTLVGGSTWPTTITSTAATSPADAYNYSIYAMTNPPNVAPVVNAGADQSVILPFSANLAGTAPDDGVPLAPGTITTAWSTISGPGTVTFGNSTAAATTASFTDAGSYVLRLTATDALLSAFDEVAVEVGASGTYPPDFIYRETFGCLDSVTLLNSPSVGWKRYSASTVGANISETSGTSGLGRLANATGRPTDLDNVNAGTTVSQANGFAYNQGVAQALDFTTEFFVNRDSYTPTTISWYSHVSDLTGISTQNAAVRIGGQWYVTAVLTDNLNNNGSSANFGTSAQLFTVNFSSATWRTLSAATGSPFALGGSDFTLPAGNIDAFGVYFTVSSNTYTSRFDTYEIKASPTQLFVWRSQYFTPTELANPALEATRWGNSADPDKNGITNIMERALGTDPLNSSSGGLPTVGMDFSGALTITFKRAASDLTYIVEGSSDLSNPSGWVAIPYTPGLVGGHDTVTDNLTTSPRFLRLRVQ